MLWRRVEGQGRKGKGMVGTVEEGEGQGRVGKGMEGAVEEVGSAGMVQGRGVWSHEVCCPIGLSV